MNKKNLAKIIIVIVVVISMIAGGTYAYWVWNSTANKNVVFTTASLEEQITYNEGPSYFIGDFEAHESFCQGANATISFYKSEEAENTNIFATINMDINSIGTNIAASDSVYWVLTSGDNTISCENGLNSETVLNYGKFTGKIADETIPLKENIEVQTVEQKFTIWIWIDINGNDLDKLSGETIDTNIWTQFDMLEQLPDQEKYLNIYYNVNDGIIAENPTYNWSVDDTGIIYSGGTLFKHVRQVGSEDPINLINPNSEDSKITKDGSSIKTEAEWICLSGCSTEGATYKVSEQYTASDFCDLSADSCTVILGTNWETNTVTINYSINGGVFGTTTSTSTWTSDENEIIYLNGSKLTHTINYGGQLGTNGLQDPDNQSSLNIVKTGSIATDGAEWICAEGCTTIGTVYEEETQYSAEDFCDISETSCTVLLKVNWSNIGYTISYDLNNGTAGTNKPTTGVYDTPIQISNPTKTVTITGNANGTDATVGTAASKSLTFEGWTFNGDTSSAKYGTSNTTIDTAWSNASTKVTAQYFKNLTTTNNATVTMTANWTASSVTLPTVTKTNYTCTWNTNAAGTGTSYDSGASYSISANSASSITLYAICTANYVDTWQTRPVFDEDGNVTCKATTDGTTNPCYTGSGDTARCCIEFKATSNSPSSQAKWIRINYNEEYNDYQNKSRLKITSLQVKQVENASGFVFYLGGEELYSSSTSGVYVNGSIFRKMSYTSGGHQINISSNNTYKTISINSSYPQLPWTTSEFTHAEDGTGSVTIAIKNLRIVRQTSPSSYYSAFTNVSKTVTLTDLRP